MLLKIKNFNFKINEEKKIYIKELNIKKGEYILISGSNGTGKTKLSFVISGLEDNYEGEIYFNNKIASKKDLLKNVGVIFQNPENQFFASNVEEDLAFSLEIRNIKDRDLMRKMIDDVLEKLNISHLKNEEINYLSGGEKQLLAIASMLLLEKKILIFDESTSMLDPENKEKVKNIIKELNEKGKTIIFITHDEENFQDEYIKDKTLYILEKGGLHKYAKN